jgi:hypothetical protein
MVEDDTSEFLEQLAIEDMIPQHKVVQRPLYGGQEEIGEEVSPEPVYADEAIFLQDGTEAVEFDNKVPEMSEVEKRLQKAVLYQQWANGNLYDQKTVATIEVEAEFREFALKQLNKLIGIQQENEVLSSFDEFETTALKSLAQMIIKNPALLGSKKAKEVVKEPAKIAPKLQPKITPKPPVVAAKPVGRPKLRQQEVPQEIAPKQPVVVKTPIPAQVQQSRQVKSPVQQNQQNQQRPVVRTNPRGPQFFQDGANIEENGKSYTIKWSQTAPSAYGPAEEIRLNNMPQKTCLLLKDGITVYKTEGDEFFKIIKMDKTPKMRPVEAIPFPQNMTLATMAAADAGANAVNNRFVRSIGK